MSTTDCPPRDVLDRWASGELADDDADAIAEHLDTCADCERTIANFPDAGFLALSTVVTVSPRFDHEVECEAFVAGLQSLAPNSRYAHAAAPENDRWVGRRIRDYQLLGRLGQGAMGAVYSARHTRLNKNVALKLLTEKLHDNPAAVTRFQREMQALGRLEHQNIVQALDAGEADGISFLVMELIDGVDLARLIKGGCRLDVTGACEIARQAAVGLQYAHSKGLVHRDVKPSNLMLMRGPDDQPRVKILDLGLASIEGLDPHEHLTDDGQLMGTLEFMAPEQAEDSHSVDYRADLYSMGVTLFRLLTGSVPFTGPEFNTPIKRLKALTHAATPSIASRLDDLPAELVVLVDRMLARDPNERPHDMAEVATRLQEFAAGNELERLLQRSHVEPVQKPSTKTEFGNAELPDTARSHDEHVAFPFHKNEAVKRLLGSGSKWPRSFLLLLASLPFAAMLLATIWLKTDGGYIRIETKDPSIEVSVEILAADRHLTRVDVGAGGDRFWYRSGSYEVRFPKDADDNLEIAGGEVTLSRGGERVVTISRIATPESQRLAPGRPTAPSLSDETTSEDRVVGPMASIPPPTRDLPDITKLPKGKVRVFGTLQQPMALGAAADFDDFVEVQKDTNIGWFGLRSNGDVVRWHVDRGLTMHRTGQNVRALNRTAGTTYGAWLASGGKIITRTHPDRTLLAKAPQTSIVDLGRSYPTGDWTVLTNDGRLHYIGETEFPPPTEITDFVRLGNWHDCHVGIRESGELVVWGCDPAQLPDLSGLRFAKIRSSEFHTLLLTAQGTLLQLNKAQIYKLPEELDRNGWIDIACGSLVWAARQADGRWHAWGGPRGAEVIAKINSLGPNVPSISMTHSAAVWIETD